jgi:hypothetical protein
VTVAQPRAPHQDGPIRSLSGIDEALVTAFADQAKRAIEAVDTLLGLDGLDRLDALEMLEELALDVDEDDVPPILVEDSELCEEYPIV